MYVCKRVNESLFLSKTVAFVFIKCVCVCVCVCVFLLVVAAQWSGMAVSAALCRLTQSGGLGYGRGEESLLFQTAQLTTQRGRGGERGPAREGGETEEERERERDMK